MRRRFSLEKLFYFLSRSDDLIHLTEPADKIFINGLLQNGFELATSWMEGDFLPQDSHLIEWGKLNELEDSFLKQNLVKFEASSYLNSKVTQAEWKTDFGQSRLKSKLITSEEHLLDYLNDIDHPIVLKAEFGLAGRNHIILENPSQSWKLQQISKKLFRYPVIAEEWVGKNRNLDFSTLWEFGELGPIYLGSTEMIIEEDGSFRGICMSGQKEKQLTFILPDCLEVMKNVFSSSERKPIGPAAMDGFFFHRNSEQNVQILSEINFRFSIGRILYEIRKRRSLRTDESGIVFLPLNKMKPFNEEKWLQLLKDESKAEFFFVTPLRDWKGKFFQNVGIYYETNEKSLPAQTIINWLFEQWKIKLES